MFQLVKNCSLVIEKDYRKQDKGASDFHCETTINNIAVCCYIENKEVTLFSSFSSVKPANNIHRYDWEILRVRLSQSFIIHLFKKNMEAIDKLDMSFFLQVKSEMLSIICLYVGTFTCNSVI